MLDLSWVWAGRLRGKLPSAVTEAQKDVNPNEIDPLFHNVNRGKRSLLLGMKSEGGRALFLRLVAEADIVIESFRPHVLASRS